MAKKEIQKVDVEPTTPQIELLKAGAAIVKLENDTQFQVSLQRPRDRGKILAEACKSLESYPAFAENVRYRKPVGKDDKGKMNYAEGLNIRAAEALKILWGNCAAAGEIVGENDDSVIIACAFVDYETNGRTAFTRRVSKGYTTKEKRFVTYAPDRMDLVVAAKMSILLRETILRSLPPELKMAYEDKAVQIMRKRKAPDRLAKMLKAFEAIGVSQKQLETLQEKPYKDFTQDDADALTGIYNAIQEKETNIEDVFGAAKEPQTKTKSNLKIKQTPTKPAIDPNKRYLCTANPDICGVELKYSQCELVNDVPMCPECGSLVKKI